MSTIARNLFDLLRLRAGPQDLPPSWALTAIAVAVYLGQAMVTSQNLGGETEAGRSVLATVLQFTAIAVMLRFRGHPERLQQTLLALAFAGIVLGLLAYLLLIQADPQAQQPFMFLVWFAIFGWSLAIDAHILRHALSVSMSTGVLLAVLLLAATYMVLEFAFR